MSSSGRGEGGRRDGLEISLNDNSDLKGSFCVSHQDIPVKLENDGDSYFSDNQSRLDGARETTTSQFEGCSYTKNDNCCNRDINMNVKKISDKDVREIIKDEVKELEASTDISNILKLCNRIQARVQCLSYDRYKYIVHVATGDNTKQSLTIASHWVWNEETDRFCSIHYLNNDTFLVVSVYALYVL